LRNGASPSGAGSSNPRRAGPSKEAAPAAAAAQGDSAAIDTAKSTERRLIEESLDSDAVGMLRDFAEGTANLGCTSRLSPGAPTKDVKNGSGSTVALFWGTDPLAIKLETVRAERELSKTQTR
jgi:hypothetical protein